MKLSKQEKVLYCFDKIILKYTGESKTSQLCLMRPMRAHVVSQLFYIPFFVNLKFKMAATPVAFLCMPNKTISLGADQKECSLWRDERVGHGGKPRGLARARACKLWRQKWFSTCYAECKMRAVCFDCSYNAVPVIKFFFISSFTLFVRDFERKDTVNALKRPRRNGLLSQGEETNSCSCTVVHCRLCRRRRQRKSSRW